jgi:hypothetical protein
MRPLRPRHVLPATAGAALLFTAIPSIAGHRGAAAAAPTMSLTNCRPLTGARPDAIIAAAATAMGIDGLGGRVRTSSITELASDRFQADRMYEPTPYRSSVSRFLADPQTGIAGRFPSTSAAASVPPGASVIGAPPTAARLTLRSTPDDRPMDPWVVVQEWRRAADLRSAEECYYRDYWRTVVTHTGSGGVEERLFIDTKSGYPVKLERQEPHRLFGDVLVEYLWTTWMKVGNASAPRSVFRSEDGVVERMWTHAAYALVVRDSVAELLSQGTATPQRSPRPASWDAPDTVRVNATTFLLTTPIYTNVVSLARDTVFVLDAQEGEARARADSVWIGKLFPGRHPLVLVVTDLAWPHIEGVRFWVATGVPVITHRLSKDFLEAVIARHWTLDPDLLERRRGSSKLTIHPIDGPARLGGGSIELRPIDGIASEGALMAYFPNDKFLYAGDYIQPPSFGALRPGMYRFTYLDEVVAALRKAGFSPESFAAMHVKLMPWADAMADRPR